MRHKRARRPGVVTGQVDGKYQQDCDQPGPDAKFKHRYLVRAEPVEENGAKRTGAGQPQRRCQQTPGADRLDCTDDRAGG